MPEFMSICRHTPFANLRRRILAVSVPLFTFHALSRLISSVPIFESTIEVIHERFYSEHKSYFTYRSFWTTSVGKI